MNCDLWREKIYDYCYELLDDDEQLRWQDHLTHCLECRQQLAHAQGGLAMLKKWDVLAGNSSDSLVPKTLEQLQGGSSHFSIYYWVAAAAVFLLAATLSTIWLADRPLWQFASQKKESSAQIAKAEPKAVTPGTPLKENQQRDVRQVPAACPPEPMPRNIVMDQMTKMDQMDQMDKANKAEAKKVFSKIAKTADAEKENDGQAPDRIPAGAQMPTKDQLAIREQMSVVAEQMPVVAQTDSPWAELSRCLQAGLTPKPEMVELGAWINSFTYEYPQLTNQKLKAKIAGNLLEPPIYVESGLSPWNDSHILIFLALWSGRPDGDVSDDVTATAEESSATMARHREPFKAELSALPLYRTQLLASTDQEGSSRYLQQARPQIFLYELIPFLQHEEKSAEKIAAEKIAETKGETTATIAEDEAKPAFSVSSSPIATTTRNIRVRLTIQAPARASWHNEFVVAIDATDATSRQASPNLSWVSGVVAFGLTLTQQLSWSYEQIIQLLENSCGPDRLGQRHRFIELVKLAARGK